MNYRQVLAIFVPCVAGFLGGSLASWNRVQASAPALVQGNRFELIGTDGTPVAFWEVGPGGDARMRFFTKRHPSGLDLGVLPDGRPFVRMYGKDGNKRIVLELEGSDRPVLGMGDERWEGRVVLGYIQPDALSPGWDQWGLLFRAPGSERPVAGLGMLPDSGGRMKGFLTWSGKKPE